MSLREGVSRVSGERRRSNPCGIKTKPAMSNNYFVYILTNKNHTVLYIGVTNNLVRRLQEHKTRSTKYQFTNKYNINKLVYFEEYENIRNAIAREKQLKGGSRKQKERLIIVKNPEWNDLGSELLL